MNNLAPIALFTYNRLAETQKTIEALKKNFLAIESDLYIFSDGAKNSEDFVKVLLLREYLKSIDGFKSVKIYYNEINKGLANSIIDGVTFILSQFSNIIVLEDDLITSPNFLDFMNQGLDFYQNQSVIISLSGYSFELPSLSTKIDNYFSYRASSWGWATWSNRWEKVDWEMKSFDGFIKDKKLIANFLMGGDDLVRLLKSQKKGNIDSWAIRFCFHQSINNLFTVYPTISKIQSIGFSKDATHTIGVNRFITKLDSENKRDFDFLKFTSIDQRLTQEFRRKFSIKSRLIDRIHSFLIR